MARHVKGFSGSKPLDPVGGVKSVQIVVKMNKHEAGMATWLAHQRQLSRSELIRQLLQKELDASNEEFMANYFKLERKKKRSRA